MGINGSGKSTLLKILYGEEVSDTGKIVISNDKTINYLSQQPILDSNLSILEQIYQCKHPHFLLLNEYKKLSEYLEYTYTNTSEEYLLNSKKHNILYQRIEAEDAYKIEVKARSILTILGFTDLNMPIHTLSGGQQRRVDLARVLLDTPDILLLDEPTNHLDTDIIEWLQDYLIEYKGIIIFVTHDRYFLDAVSNKILEIDRQKIQFYPGNYSEYLKRKELEDIDLQRKETRRQAQLKKEMKWLQRGAKARTAKPKDHLDRVKELIDKSYLTTEQELEISFQTQRLGKTILEIKNLCIGYESSIENLSIPLLWRGRGGTSTSGNMTSFTEKSLVPKAERINGFTTDAEINNSSPNILLNDFSYNFQKNDRIGIIGPNGCGKSTLIKVIVEEIKQLKGKIKIGHNTKIAYLSQEDPILDPKQTVSEYVKSFAENIRTKDGVLHSTEEILERFLFDKKKQFNKISTLSGGEKKRLYLLTALIFGSNFLILDEPTNDLDIRTLEILEDYLDAYQGCIVLISHDRFILDRITDFLFIFEEDKSIRKFPGNYSDYLLVKKFSKEKTHITNTTQKPTQKEKKDTKLSYKEEQLLQKTEQEIESLEHEKDNINENLSNNAMNLKPTDFTNLSNRLKYIEDRLIELYEIWESLTR